MKAMMSNQQNGVLSPIVVPGYYYAVSSTDSSTSSEFILVCKAITSLQDEFQALKYRKSEVCDSSVDVLYEETICSLTLNLDTVVGQLVSARAIGSTLLVNSVEIDEMIISISSS